MYNPVQPISILDYIQGMMNAASTKLPNDASNDRFLRENEVLQMTRLSRSGMYRRIKSATFPRPIRIGKRYRLYSLIEVQRWMEARKAQSR